MGGQASGGCRAYGIVTGELPAGPSNSIIDVAGVSLAHLTLADGELQTGVTAILPHCGNLFRDKVPAACRVINGFGKSAGLVQVEELGSIESPILLTNTFSVAACLEGGLDVLLSENPDIATTTGSANVLVLECNDAYLSDMRRRAISPAQVTGAIQAARASAGAPFERGAVGAGRGMSCYGLKGGIGSASRIAGPYTVGALLLTNFGRLEELVVDGRRVGRELAAETGGAPDSRAGAGSVIVILACDAPLDSRQLKRLCIRAASGLARTGAVIGGGSGEIVVAFSTAYTLRHYPAEPVSLRPCLHEDGLDPLFRAATEAVEEAVLDSLFTAGTVRGRAGHERRSILDLGLF